MADTMMTKDVAQARRCQALPRAFSHRKGQPLANERW